QVAHGRQAYVVYPVIESAGEEGDRLVGDPDSGGPGAAPRPAKKHLARKGATTAPPGKSPDGSISRFSETLSGEISNVLPKRSPSPKTSLKSATNMYQELCQNIFPDLRIGLLHGRLSSDEKELVMARFQRGEIDVLVATTVIEVGVDVQNATVMVIEHAERFGLSQLHQLRGRIGRGANKSYCVLMTGRKIRPKGERRPDPMTRT